jgi:hypothetical protein
MKKETCIEWLSRVPDYLVVEWLNKRGIDLKKLAKEIDSKKQFYKKSVNYLFRGAIICAVCLFASFVCLRLFEMGVFSSKTGQQTVGYVSVSLFTILVIVSICIGIISYRQGGDLDLEHKEKIFDIFVSWIEKIQYPHTESLDPNALTIEAIGNQIRDLAFNLLVSKKLYELKSAREQWRHPDNVLQILRACQFIDMAQKRFDEAWNRLQGFDAFKHLKKQSFFDLAKNDLGLISDEELGKLDLDPEIV